MIFQSEAKSAHHLHLLVVILNYIFFCIRRMTHIHTHQLVFIKSFCNSLCNEIPPPLQVTKHERIIFLQCKFLQNLNNIFMTHTELSSDRRLRTLFYILIVSEKGCLPAALYPHIRTYTGNSRLPHYPRYIYQRRISQTPDQSAYCPLSAHSYQH